MFVDLTRYHPVPYVFALLELSFNHMLFAQGRKSTDMPGTKTSHWDSDSIYDPFITGDRDLNAVKWRILFHHKQDQIPSLIVNKNKAEETLF